VLCPVCLLDACLAAAPTSGDEVAEMPHRERALTVPEHLRRFGDYELLEELGRGAMGVVYRARQLSLDREVAVKFLLAGPLASGEMVERFHREAVAAGALQHPNIVAVHEVGVHQGQPYLVMECVAGSSLAEVISERRLELSDTRRCVRWVRTLGRAVHYAHEHGILHRDLKPSNVLIDAEDQPHVMDFGLARNLITDSQLTLSDQVLGSPCYLPPEQAGGGRTVVGRPSDVYALGAMLYHLLTGRPPFVGESPAEVIRAVLESEPVRPRLVNPRVPRDLEIICLKCLEKEPARRYATARELADDLERFLNNEPIQARPVGFVGRAWRWSRRKPAQAGLAAGLLLAVVLGLAAVGWQWSKTQAMAAREIRERERAERTVYRLQIQTAEEYFARHRAAEGLAVLAALLRRDPADRAVAERLMSELTSRHWALPVVGPLAHPDPVHYAEYSPDGGRLLTASLDNTARLWDALTGQPQGRPLEHDRGERFHPEVFTGGQKCLVAHFSPDGRRVATGSVDHSAKVWDGHTGELLLGPLLHPDWVVDIAFSPDGQILATACRDGGVRRWRLSTGEAIEPTLRHADWVSFVQFDADGRWLLSGSQDGTARVWDAITGEPVGKTLKHPGAVRAGQFSPDGQWVATASADTTARLWHATTGEPSSPPLRHDAAVSAVRFSPDGVWLATASFDQTIRLWDVPSGTARSRPLEHGGTVRSLEFSPEAERLLSASEDKTVRVWDFRVGQPAMEPIRHTAAAWSARFSPDGQRIVTASSDHTCMVWDARPAAALATELSVNRAVHSLQWSPDGRRLMAQAARPRLFVRSSGWSEAGDLWADQDTLCVEFSPDGSRIATGSSDGGARLWDVEKLQIILRVRHVGAVFSTCFRHDGRRLLTASSDRLAAVWSAETGEQLFSLPHPARLRRAGFDLRSERILTVCDDDQVRVWSATSGVPLLTWRPHARRLNDAAFSPDGHRVITCSEDGTARVWDTATARPLTCPLRHRGNVGSAVFSPDGHWLLTASEDNTAAIWECSPAPPAPLILRHQAAVYSARFSADGRRVATASQDQTARLWDAVTGQPLGSPWRHNGAVRDAVFSPDGTLLATAAGQSVWVRPVAQADPAMAQRWADLAEVVAGLRDVNQSSSESVAPAAFHELARQWETDP
jgi:WD40 repeat protein